MSVKSNKIDVALTGEQVASITAALVTLEEAIPFVISLTVAERKGLFKLGTRSEGFVREALTAALEYPDNVPASLGVAEMQRDLALREALLPVLQRVRTIYTMLNDTWMLAGADAMQIATAIYRVLKSTAGEGLDETISVLKQRFERSSTPTEPPTEPVVG